jgi:hypothetical protein
VERLMEAAIANRVREANSKLRELLLRARDALVGRHNFNVEDVRAIAEPVAQMAPIVADAARLRVLQPDLDGQLEAYAANLGELQITLEHVRFMLIARRAHLAAARSHLETFGLWAATLRQTR